MKAYAPALVRTELNAKRVGVVQEGEGSDALAAEAVRVRLAGARQGGDTAVTSGRVDGIGGCQLLVHKAL
ncbi:MAG: hypothetical protein ACPIOQ_41950, partial [Promethearchaeia archaeon]